MNKLEYFSDVKEAKFSKKISLLIAEELKNFEGKRVKITIEQSTTKRTLNQNSLFHVYVDFLAKELGYEKNLMKDIIKYKFLLTEFVDETSGEVYKFVRQTSKLSKIEFIELVDSLIRWAAEMNIILRDPEQYYEQVYGQNYLEK